MRPLTHACSLPPGGFSLLFNMQLESVFGGLDRLYGMLFLCPCRLSYQVDNCRTPNISVKDRNYDVKLCVYVMILSSSILGFTRGDVEPMGWKLP